MIDRYYVSVSSKKGNELFCSTFFRCIDEVIKFIIRFDLRFCDVSISDELFPEREITPTYLLSIWNSKE